MLDSSVETGQGDSRYGFGLEISGTGEDSRISHSGAIPGFNSILTLAPEQNLHVAVLSNSPLPAATVAELILEAITSEEPPPVPRIDAQPGSGDAVRRMIEEIRQGDPDYSMMHEDLAEATRSQLPQLQALFVSLGPIESIIFRNVSLQNADIYDLQFARGSITYFIMLDEDGKTMSAFFQLTSAPPA